MEMPVEKEQTRHLVGMTSDQAPVGVKPIHSHSFYYNKEHIYHLFYFQMCPVNKFLYKYMHSYYAFQGILQAS